PSRSSTRPSERAPATCRSHRVRVPRVAGLEGKTAIVTGASSGIGAAIARALAAQDARVAGGARRVEQLETDVKLELDVTYPVREDLLGRPIHLTTVDPGLVESNFSRVRFRGDEEKASAVYANVEPLTPDDIAECVLFVLTRPAHVNIDELVVKALAQSTPVLIARDA